MVVTAWAGSAVRAAAVAACAAGCAVATAGAATGGPARGFRDSATAVRSGVCGAGAAAGGAGVGAPPVTAGVCAIPLGGPSFARLSFACSSSISRIAFSIAARLLAVASFDSRR